MVKLGYNHYCFYYAIYIWINLLMDKTNTIMKLLINNDSD